MDSPTFGERLSQRILDLDSRVCLGIDPRPASHPSTDPERLGYDAARIARSVVSYFLAIIERTQDLVACYKLQSAFFESLGVAGIGAMAELLAEIRSHDIPVILDAKRGDIASSAEAYAEAYLGTGELTCDALTINPYLGMDSLEPFFQAAHRYRRGVFVLVKTSNPGSRDFQDCELAPGRPLYRRVAEAVASAASRHTIDPFGFSPIGAVVGATHPRPLATLRRTLPQSYLLIPGYGAQGGSSEAVAAAFLPEGLGAVVNSSRGLTYLTREDDFAERAELAARRMRDDINRAYRQA